MKKALRTKAAIATAAALITPDGYYVDANGVWNQGTAAGAQQQVSSIKDVAATLYL